MAAQLNPCRSGTCDVRLLGWPRLPRLNPKRRRPDHVDDAGNAHAARSPEEGIASDPALDLQLPLAAVAALYRPDRRAGRLCGAVSERVVASLCALLRFQRTADHAGGAWPDRRR